MLNKENNNEVVELEEGKEEVLVTEENLVDEKKEEKKEEKNPKKTGMFIRLLAGVIDQIIVLAVALVMLIVFDLIIHLAGYYVVEREPVFLIIYVIMNIIYTPICESLKINKTIGKKILFK